MRWTLVALVISCAHDEPPVPKPQSSPPPPPVVVDARADAVADAEIVDEVPDARPTWHALLDNLPLVNVEHVAIAPLEPSSAGAQPSIRLGDVRTSERIEAHVALRVLRQSLSRPLFCYENELRTAPDLDKVRVKLRFVVNAAGDVVFGEATSPSAPETLLRCIERALSSLSVPPPHVWSAIETTLLVDQPLPSPSRARIGPR